MGPRAITRLGLMTALLLLTQNARPIQAQSSEKVEKITSVEGITEHRLDNGLRFLFFPDPSAAKVVVNMTVLVGSRHEGYGEAGMAHLLEHMLFKGCKAFPEPWKALTDHGAQFNGTTWLDRTNYYEIMESTNANLEFGIKLEADRLVHSFIRREDLAKEMTVVRSEFEAGENNPEYILSQRMTAVAYEWHNYGKSTIGNRADIERVPIDRLQRFYRKYYQPDNVILTVAGRFDEKKALEYITRYFGPIPRPSRLLEKTYTEEPPQDGERNVILRRVGKVAVVGILYHVPAAAHPDFAAVEVLDDVLTDEPSGRLYKALVETKKATRVTSSIGPTHDPGTLEIMVHVADTSTPEEVRGIMLDVLEKFKPATRDEIARSRQRFKSQFDQAITKSDSIAIHLSNWMGAGDWRLMFLNRDRIAKVTAKDVDRVAAKYLQATNRTLGIYLPSEKVARTPIPETPAIAKLMKGYTGAKALTRGEAFDPSPENIEKRVQRQQLPCGVKAALLPKKTRGEMVVGELILRFGNEKSLAEYPTASSLLGPLMLRGTRKHSRQEIEDALNKLGASLTFTSKLGTLSMNWQVKRPNLPMFLDLLHEILREPAFPEKELDILKRERQQTLQKAMVDPIQLSIRYMMRTLQPYPRDDVRYQPTIAESLDRLAKTSREQIQRLYDDQLGAQVGELVLAGDLDPKQVTDRFSAMLDGWRPGVPFERIKERAFTNVPGSRKDIITPDKANAIYAGGLTFELTDTAPDYPALELGNFLLGGAPTSRIFDRLRQKEGLSYGAGSQLSVASQDPVALFLMFAICNPKNIDKADRAALDVVARTLKDGFSDKEIADGKNAYLQEQKVQRSNDRMLVRKLAQYLYLGRTFTFQADLERKIADLTAREVNQALARYIIPSRLVIVRGGDFKK
jgi:zinc protease